MYALYTQMGMRGEYVNCGIQSGLCVHILWTYGYDGARGHAAIYTFRPYLYGAIFHDALSDDMCRLEVGQQLIPTGLIVAKFHGTELLLRWLEVGRLPGTLTHMPPWRGLLLLCGD